MVILIISQIIKQHPSIHLLYILTILGYVACEGKKIRIIHKRLS